MKISHAVLGRRVRGCGVVSRRGAAGSSPGAPTADTSAAPASPLSADASAARLVAASHASSTSTAPTACSPPPSNDGRKCGHLHMLHVASRYNRSICLYQNIKMKRCRFHSSTLAALTSPLLDDIQFCPLLRICALGKSPGNSSFGISSVESPAKLIHSSGFPGISQDIRC